MKKNMGGRGKESTRDRLRRKLDKKKNDESQKKQ